MIEPTIDQGAAWQALAEHAKGMRTTHLSELFAGESGRHAAFTRQAAGLTLDLSKQRWDAETLTKLLDLARQAKVPEAIRALLEGERVNRSEDRPALHTALRLPAEASLVVEGEDLVPSVHATLDRMATMVERFHAGQWRGATGKAIRDVVNLGVGGSDLGPLMVTHALADYRPRDVHAVDVHFASTMDGSQLADYLSRLNPETTLFVL
ncbi:MAG: glucose-6-phosphate isomerase, partial [Halomonas sp.]|nr:glucose-6-phosphate isomerase [Halomonas sp.]